MALQSDTFIPEGTAIQGSVRHGRRVEVNGLIVGDVTAETLIIGSAGRVVGRIKAENAEVDGHVQGNVTVKSLLAIGASGKVIGDVQYGQMSMVPGATLSAEVRNIPPTLAGDFHLEITRGGHVVVTVRDLAAIDPDDRASDLIFMISNPRNGWVARSGDPATAIEHFSQLDIEHSTIIFVHDGTATNAAAFDVAVSDATGASSGVPRTVYVDVKYDA